ncbi:hypothetical protein [Desulfatiglans anilini]|nr:hypothetical protein [Desulfatiglans anilini]
MRRTPGLSICDEPITRLRGGGPSATPAIAPSMYDYPPARGRTWDLVPR